MGNNSSKSGTPSHASSPSPANQNKDDSNVPTRRPLKRRESVNLHPVSKPTAVSPTASVESATGQLSSQSRTSKSSSRRRSTTEGRLQKQSDAPAEGDDGRTLSRVQTTASSTTTRSISPSQPMDVPAPASASTSITSSSGLLPGGPSAQSPANYYLPNTQFYRPPRLPLPIEEEVLQPGSPIISPSDISSAISHNDADIPRRTSMLSSTTADDDDLGEDFSAHDVAEGPRVEKLIEWKQGGDKVYVTGTFTNWNRKFRLHKDGPSKDPKALSAMVQFPIGTHHLRFLVDNVMMAANTMPTAVDYTNVLVNYIEVTQEELHKKAIMQADIPHPTGEKTTLVERQRLHTEQSPQRTADSPSNRDGKRAGTSSIVSENVARGTPSRASPTTHQQAPLATPVKKQSDARYTPEIPRYLIDLDAPEESSRFQRANAVMSTQPQPPSLPMFLGKSIINATTPMKDDSSVLIMPNHTVLNHLATSSIKNNVLATSATTRYKRKYVTTICYRPTSDTGD